MKEATIDYNDNLKKNKIKLLKQIDWLWSEFNEEDEEMNLQVLSFLQFYMLEEQIYEGVEIFSSGDYCDSIIFIIEG